MPTAISMVEKPKVNTLIMALVSFSKNRTNLLR